MNLQLNNLPVSNIRNLSSNDMRNLSRIVSTQINPIFREVPVLQGFDFFSEVMYLHENSGGDHCEFIDFKKVFDLEKRIEQAKAKGRINVADELVKNNDKVGILISDVTGHEPTDVVLTAKLLGAMKMGMLNQLRLYGHVTTRLFDDINYLFCEEGSTEKSITLMYGEIFLNGVFKYINAGHPPPVIYSSREEMLKVLDPRLYHGTKPVGIGFSREHIDSSKKINSSVYDDKFKINELLVQKGDILICGTDGMFGLEHEGNMYFPRHLEEIVKKYKNNRADEIGQAIKEDVLKFSRKLQDDTSFAIITRN